MKKRIDPATVKSIVRMLQSNIPIRVTARQTGTSPTTVQAVKNAIRPKKP